MDNKLSVGLLWKTGRAVAETSTCTKHNIHEKRTTTPPAGFEPAIPASDRPHIYALDRGAAGIGTFEFFSYLNRTVVDI
jgi:hypothetical protein